MKPGLSAVKAWTHNHRTTKEFPPWILLKHTCLLDGFIPAASLGAIVICIFGLLGGFFLFCFLLVSVEPCSSGILVPQPRIKPAPLAVRAQSSDHWAARELLWSLFLKVDKDGCLTPLERFFFF